MLCCNPYQSISNFVYWILKQEEAGKSGQMDNVDSGTTCIGVYGMDSETRRYFMNGSGSVGSSLRYLTFGRVFLVPWRARQIQICKSEIDQWPSVELSHLTQFNHGKYSEQTEECIFSRAIFCRSTRIHFPQYPLQFFFSRESLKSSGEYYNIWDYNYHKPFTLDFYPNIQ